MNDWDSLKELQTLCGKVDLICMYDERKLFLVLYYKYALTASLGQRSLLF